ncbi:MAG: hypothetical protein WCJ84_01625 [Candidatus Peregrinibacteria bacterium]
MDALHVRQILMQFSNGINCPYCQSKIEIPWVEVISTEDNRCTIKVDCRHCHQTFGGQAQTVVKLTNEGKKLNTSSILQNDPLTPPQISETEVHIIHHVLEHPQCSVSAIFPKEKEEAANVPLTA